MKKRLEGKVAVVTGGGRGIGRAIAMEMARQGAKVLVNDLGCQTDGTCISSAIAEETAQAIRSSGGIAIANHESVATKSGSERIVQSSVDQFGGIDILVNNAGIIRDTFIWDMSDEAWDAVVKTHLYGHFYCTRAAVTRMLEKIRLGTQKKGRIINITSHAGIKGGPLFPAYSAAKMGIVGFTYSCANALWKYGITCNAVAPHAMTRFVDTLTENDLRRMAESRGVTEAQSIPIGEVKDKLFAPPEAIAPVVCWLASDMADRISGEIFAIRAGRVGLFSHMNEAILAVKNGIFDLDEIWDLMPILTEGHSEQH